MSNNRHKTVRSVVTLSKENDKKLLQQLKRNKYRSQMAILPKNNNLNYLIDPRFTKVNRLFVLSFARIAEGDRRDSFSHYYVPNVEIKDFNVLIDGKRFFDFPVKNEEVYEKIIEMTRNNDQTTGNLLDFAYFKEYYRLIVIDLSKQTNNLKDLLQISLIGKLENQAHGATIFFAIEKSEETTFEFLQNSLKILIKMETQKIANLLNSSENEYSKFATTKK